LKQLAESAKEFYLEGYALRDVNPNKAAERWQEVLQIVPKRDPYYRKARTRIRAEMPGRLLSGKEGVPGTGLQVAKSPKEIYREGYALYAINPDKALEKWTEVLKALPPGDPYHKKAAAFISRQEQIP